MLHAAGLAPSSLHIGQRLHDCTRFLAHFFAVGRSTPSYIAKSKLFARNPKRLDPDVKSALKSTIVLPKSLCIPKLLAALNKTQQIGRQTAV
jgi:hypothetical protein